MTDINIYVITSDELPLRTNNLNQQLQKFKSIFDNKNFKPNFNQIKYPSNNDIKKTINEFKDRIDYNTDNIQDADFKRIINPLNFNQLSNYVKHHKILDKIKKSNTKYNFVIEDDILIIDEFIDNFKYVIDSLKSTDYDIIFTSIAVNEIHEEKTFKNTFDFFKVIVAKSSYFITPDFASKLFEFFDKIRFPYKIALSYYIWLNKNSVKSFIFNKNVLFEGSKLGLYTTSCNNNNYLYQNGDFIKLNQLINNANDNMNDDLVKQAEIIYNNSGKNNPDFQQLLGLAYYKNKNYKKAKDIYIEAVFNLKKYDGLITENNEVLNNCINMHQFEQSDIDNLLLIDGIYH